MKSSPLKHIAQDEQKMLYNEKLPCITANMSVFVIQKCFKRLRLHEIKDHYHSIVSIHDLYLYSWQAFQKVSSGGHWAAPWKYPFTPINSTRAIKFQCDQMWMENSEAQKRKQKAEVIEFVLGETLVPNGNVSYYLVRTKFRGCHFKTMFSQSGYIQVNQSTVCLPTSVYLFACKCVYVWVFVTSLVSGSKLTAFYAAFAVAVCTRSGHCSPL